MSHAQADDETGRVTAELKTLQDEIAAKRKVRRSGCDGDIEKLYA